jgi:hypothetical protein
VAFTVGTGRNLTTGDCVVDGGETGTGLLNSASITGSGTNNAVTACASSPPIEELPHTGINTLAYLNLALLLLAAGGCLTCLARRRRLVPLF